MGPKIPSYGRFWETFIGLKNASSPFQPYGLRIPAGIPQTNAAAIGSAYTEIAYAHYSLFCELAGAHFQLDEVRNSYSSNAGDRLFLFLEAFNGFYDHIGTARNMVIRLWCQAQELARVALPTASIARKELVGGLAVFDSTLSGPGAATVKADAQTIETEAVDTRDHHIHNYAAFFVPINGTNWFVVGPEEAQRLSRAAGFPVREQEALRRMEGHLTTMSRFVEASEANLLSELGGVLKGGGIDVAY